jgi:putative hemolysin
VLLKVAKYIDGQDQIAKRRVEEALRETGYGQGPLRTAATMKPTDLGALLLHGRLMSAAVGGPWQAALLSLLLSRGTCGLAQASDSPDEAVDSQARERYRAGQANPAHWNARQQLGAAEHSERRHGPQCCQGGYADETSTSSLTDRLGGRAVSSRPLC